MSVTCDMCKVTVQKATSRANFKSLDQTDHISWQNKSLSIRFYVHLYLYSQNTNLCLIFFVSNTLEWIKWEHLMIFYQHVKYSWFIILTRAYNSPRTSAGGAKLQWWKTVDIYYVRWQAIQNKQTDKPSTWLLSDRRGISAFHRVAPSLFT